MLFQWTIEVQNLKQIFLEYTTQNRLNIGNKPVFSEKHKNKLGEV